MTRIALTSFAAGLVLMLSTPLQAAVDEMFESENGPIRVTTFVEGLSHPWAIAFLPDGGMLVTERAGALRYVAPDGQLSAPLRGVPPVVAQRQGGLLDVALDPDFAQNRLVYFSYAEAGMGGSGTAVARGVLNTDVSALQQVQVIFRQRPKVVSSGHYGSRLVFSPQGHLFITLGDRESFRDNAQDVTTHIGTIVRINPDGTIPQDNPFVGQADALPEIWAHGVRNSQAAAIHPETGVLWEIEHGPRGGDELNIVQPGGNYGWPVATFGVEYYGLRIGEGITSAPGMIDPVYQWTPVIAPSGMMFYGADAFPDWQGNLFVGGLGSTALVRLELDGNAVAREERLLENLGFRIRDVAQGPDGAIYVATDEKRGEVLRIAPVD